MATPHVPKKTLENMKKSGITENDVLDTFNNGEHFTTSRGSHKMVKRYPSYGYVISLLYFYDNSTGEPVIVYVSKRAII